MLRGDRPYPLDSMVETARGLPISLLKDLPHDPF